MLTAACAIIALAVLAAVAWFAYVVGLTKNVRDSAKYKAGLASGYWKGRCEGEGERDDLLERVARLSDERDQIKNAALNVLAQHDALAAQHGDIDGAYADAREVSA